MYLYFLKFPVLAAAPDKLHAYYIPHMSYILYYIPHFYKQFLYLYFFIYDNTYIYYFSYLTYVYIKCPRTRSSRFCCVFFSHNSTSSFLYFYWLFISNLPVLAAAPDKFFIPITCFSHYTY